MALLIKYRLSFLFLFQQMLYNYNNFMGQIIENKYSHKQNPSYQKNLGPPILPNIPLLSLIPPPLPGRKM